MTSIDDAIREAIIAKFFEPTTLILSQPAFDPTTGVSTVQTFPSQTEAPALRVARAIWDAKQQAITDAVMARLDIDTIVDSVVVKVTAVMVDRLMKEPDNRWSSNPTKSQRQIMLDSVYAKVAEEFGRQCVEHLRQTGGLMGILEAPQDCESGKPRG